MNPPFLTTSHGALFDTDCLKILRAMKSGVNELKLVVPAGAILISTDPGDLVFKPFGRGVQPLRRERTGVSFF